MLTRAQRRALAWDLIVGAALVGALALALVWIALQVAPA